MKIASYIVQQDRGLGKPVYLGALVTRSHDKTFPVVVTLGRIEDGEAFMSPVGEACIWVHGELPTNHAHVVEIATRKRVRVKVGEALERAKNGTLLIFLCDDSLIYDDCIKELHVDWKSIDAVSV